MALLETLTHFDAPTGFAAGVNSTTAKLNSRKQFLTELGVLNRVGVKQDGITVEGDTLFIGGRPLSALNAQLREQGAGELTLIPTSTFCRALGKTYGQLLETGLNLINPPPVPGLLGDKAMQYWELYGTTLAVPPWQPIEPYLSEDGTGFRELQTAFIEDAPLVLKARSSTHGDGIWFYPEGVTAVIEDWQQGTAPTAFLEAPQTFLLQYAVPHTFDRRIIAAGETPVSGEDRYGSPHTDRSNLNLVSTEARTPRGAAEELLARGAVEPLNMERIDPAVERAVSDLHEALAALAGLPPREFHSWIGWDFLVVDPEDERLRTIPDDVLTGLLRERYRTREGRYLVFGEGNLSPGSKERYVNAVAHGRSGLRWDSAANLLNYGLSISTGTTFEPGFPALLDRDAVLTAYGL